MIKPTRRLSTTSPVATPSPTSSCGGPATRSRPAGATPGRPTPGQAARVPTAVGAHFGGMNSTVGGPGAQNVKSWPVSAMTSIFNGSVTCSQSGA
jgi:hypothetical protein